MDCASRRDGKRMGWDQEQLSAETRWSAGHVALQKKPPAPEPQSLLTPKLSAKHPGLGASPAEGYPDLPWLPIPSSPPT